LESKIVAVKIKEKTDKEIEILKHCTSLLNSTRAANNCIFLRLIIMWYIKSTYIRTCRYLQVPVICKLMYERHFGEMQTFKYGAQIIDILSVLHLTFGIYHGDIRPHNLMFLTS